MRGKPEAVAKLRRDTGITPAGAGKTSTRRYTTSPTWDHPRRCGENVVRTADLRHRRGSPPQVRGKLNRTLKRHSRDRITPAGAGKTNASRRKEISLPDHPRRCGENHHVNASFSSCVGSPPQVRGKPAAFLWAICAKGITPAGAGKTSRCSRVHLVIGDHPRRCGENTAAAQFFNEKLGSPPQVRGKRFVACLNSCIVGITPAGAGKTLKRSFRNQPFCSRAVQISFNFSNSLNVSLQSGSAR